MTVTDQLGRKNIQPQLSDMVVDIQGPNSKITVPENDPKDETSEDTVSIEPEPDEKILPCMTKIWDSGNF